MFSYALGLKSRTYHCLRQLNYGCQNVSTYSLKEMLSQILASSCALEGPHTVTRERHRLLIYRQKGESWWFEGYAQTTESKGVDSNLFLASLKTNSGKKSTNITGRL